MHMLPEDFVPGPYDVVCGRGRRCFTHIGNQYFRGVVAQYIERYSTCKSKLEKTSILGEIVTRVRAFSPKGGFVKKDPQTGRWLEVGDFLAREKTSQAFRDLMYNKYRSSNEFKKKRRRAENNGEVFDSSLESLEMDTSVGKAPFGSVHASMDADSTASLVSHRSSASAIDYTSSRKTKIPRTNSSCPELSVVQKKSPNHINFSWTETLIPLAESEKSANVDMSFYDLLIMNNSAVEPANDPAGESIIDWLEEALSDDEPKEAEPVHEKNLFDTLATLADKFEPAGNPFEPRPLFES